MSETTSRRKDSHLDLCATGEVEPAGASTLLEHVRLVHDALPDLARADVDLTTPFLGRKLRAPLLITGMTGGSERAGQVNRDLALAAEQAGVAFGLGSQRAMAEDEALLRTYRVREVAPTTVVLGNIGLAQGRALGPKGCRQLVERIGADGLCLHLNVGQELTQPEGDRDFRGGLELVRALIAELGGERLLVKETGCGIGPAVAERLFAAGVRHVDVSGAGGTSWVRVEALRADPESARLGEEFADWGVPTAAAVASVARKVPGLFVVGSGGIRSGLEAAKVLALGARLAGCALPVFRAQQAGGAEGALRELNHLTEGLARTLLLTGSRSVAELQTKPRVVTGPLRDWLAAL